MHEPSAETNAVLQTLLNHRSIREYRPDPVPDDVLHRILDAGVRAPTAGGLQHYSLMVIDDTARLRSLNADAAPLAVMALVDTYRLGRWFQRHGVSLMRDELVSLFIGFTDALLALQNVCIAAEGLGLGTCYQGTVLSADTRSLLGTPEYVAPAGLLLLGYPAEAPGSSPRLPLEAVVHRNSYQVPSDEEIDQWYAERYPDWETGRDPEVRERLAAVGIENWAQWIALGQFTRESLEIESMGLLDNLRSAGFRLPAPWRGGEP